MSPVSRISVIFCRGMAKFYIGSGNSLMSQPNSSIKVVKLSVEAMDSMRGPKADAMTSATAVIVFLSAIPFNSQLQRRDRLYVGGFPIGLGQGIEYYHLKSPLRNSQ
jgi:hypothetical protein